MFDDGDFMREDWDCSKFVKEKQLKYGLDKLKTDLETFVSTLENSLISILNDDYSAFVKLSSILVDFDSLVDDLFEPLASLQTSVDSVRSVVAQRLNSQENLVDRLYCVQEKKKLIYLCLSAEQCIEGVKRRMKEVENLRNELNVTLIDEVFGVDSPESIGRKISELIVLISQSLAHLDATSKEALNVPYFEKIVGESQKLASLLLTVVDDIFLEIIEAELPSPQLSDADTMKTDRYELTAASLQAYYALSACERGEILLTKSVILPYVNKVFSEEKIDEGGDRGDASGLGRLYGQLLQYVRNKCHCLLFSVRDPRHGLSTLDFVGLCLLKSVFDIVSKKFRNLYVNSNANTFYRTYTSTKAFIDVLNAMSVDRAFKRKLADTGNEFLGLWNLRLYTQLRANGLIRDLDSAFEEGINPTEKNTNEVYSLQATNCLQQCVKNCWDSKAFIGKNGSSVFRLTVELYARYIVWCKKILQSFSSIDSSDSREYSVGTIGPNSASQVFSVAHIIHDCRGLTEEMSGISEDIQSRMFGGMKSSTPTKSQGKSAISKALDEKIRVSLSEIVCKGEDILFQSLEKHCLEYLKAGIESVPSMYRMTNKQVSDECSAYVQRVLCPVNDFLEDSRSSLVTNDRLSEHITSLIEKLGSSFTDLSAIEIQKVISSENALKRLSRTANKTFTASSDRIKRQYALDEKAIFNNCQKLRDRIAITNKHTH